jgi:hypothetical protein
MGTLLCIVMISNAKRSFGLFLPLLFTGRPYSTDIISGNKITLKDLLIDAGWLCSGLSGMEYQVRNDDATYRKEKNKTDYLFKI